MIYIIKIYDLYNKAKHEYKFYDNYASTLTEESSKEDRDYPQEY